MQVRRQQWLRTGSQYVLTLSALTSMLLVPPWSLQAQSQGEQALRDRVESVAEKSRLNVPGLTPWHLKLAVQLFDFKGNPTEAGTVEEWWSRIDEYRIVYTFPSFTGADARSGNQMLVQKDVPGGSPYMAEYLLKQVVEPLPDAVDLSRVTPELHSQKVSGVEYDCIMLAHPIHDFSVLPLGLFPTYCLNHASNQLAFEFLFGSQVTIREKSGTFQKRDVAVALLVRHGTAVTARAQVTLLEGRATPYPEAAEVTGLVAPSPPSKVDGTVVAGKIVTKVQPVYPGSAKVRRASGKVILHAIIGVDGRIESLEPMVVPDPELAIAAISAVRQWVYTPYLVNGVPREVDTTVTVNFELR